MILCRYALNVSRMLTEGVEDTSTAIYERKFMFGKKERCLNFRQPDEVFKILHVRLSVFC